jgi:hypothetical protein
MRQRLEVVDLTIQMSDSTKEAAPSKGGSRYFKNTNSNPLETVPEVAGKA